MEIQEIRRARLAKLIKEQFDGSQAKFVEHTGENQGEVSGLLRSKSFGERKARKIEAKCDLPVGWLDSLESTDIAGPAKTQGSGEQPVLTIIENIEPQWMALVYITQRELDLLTRFRHASEIRKSLVETAAETAAPEESGTGSAHQT